jgi:glucosyl-dolichyl phosphate glucuronosyltransferase
MIMQDVSVVICTHTEARWEYLAQAVQSLVCQSVLPCEVLVVVDHNPALAERARRYLPDVTVIENRESRGTSGSRNSGIAAAQGAIIAFLDDDAIAAPDWIAQLLAGYTDAYVLGVGGAIEPLWQSGRPGWFPEEFDWVVGCTYRGMPVADGAVRNLIGCNMSFRRLVFDSIGGFRKEMGRVGAQPFGCEETELCIRLAQRWPHASLRYNPRARVWHQVPAAHARWSYFWARCYLEGRSKAQVAQLVGARDGSATERTYALRTMPRGVARSLAHMFTRLDPSGLARAGAIVAGLASTTAGYLRGSLAQAFTRRPVAVPLQSIVAAGQSSEVRACSYDQ